jgi:hypothetical protein
MTGTFKDTIMIKDRPYDRAVEVTVIAPEGESIQAVCENRARHHHRRCRACQL